MLFFNKGVLSNWTMPLPPHADKRQPSFGMQPDRHDRPYTSLGNRHAAAYQNDKKRTGIQTSGKSR